MGFEVPVFTLEKVVLTGLGAIALWGRWSSSGRLRVWGFSKLFRDLGVKGRWLVLIEFATFVAVGVFVGIAVTDPQNPRQAFVAGMGWTGLMGTHEREEKEGKPS